MLGKFINWFFYSFAISLLPIVIKGLCLATFGQVWSYGGLIEKGELLLISAVLCAAGAGELFRSSRNLDNVKRVSIGTSLLTAVLASAYFGVLSVGGVTGVTVQTDVVQIASLLVYVFALVSSVSCILLADL